jgi:hypothetical protein
MSVSDELVSKSNEHVSDFVRREKKFQKNLAMGKEHSC